MKQEMQTQTKCESREALEAKLKELEKEDRERLRAIDYVRLGNRGWHHKNMKDVQTRTINTYFEGELAKELTSFVDLVYRRTCIGDRAHGDSERAKKMREREQASYDVQHKLGEELHKHTLALFRTIRKTPEPQRLILAHAIAPAYSYQLGGSKDMEYFFGLTRHSDGDMNGNVGRALKLLKLDHLIDWTPKGDRNYGAIIPSEKLEEAYLALSKTPRDSIEKKHSQVVSELEKIRAEQEIVKGDIKYVDYANSVGLSVDALRRTMPSLIEDLKAIEKEVGSKLEKVAIDPNTKTIVALSNRSTRGRGCGYQKVVSAYRDGSITDRTYTYRDSDYSEKDKPEYDFQDISIVGADNSGVNVQLKNHGNCEIAHFSLRAERRKNG